MRGCARKWLWDKDLDIACLQAGLGTGWRVWRIFGFGGNDLIRDGFSWVDLFVIRLPSVGAPVARAWATVHE